MDSHIALRTVNVCPNTPNDNLDILKIRDISMDGEKFILQNSIFEEHILIRLNEKQGKIEIHNCEFKKGISLSWKGILKPIDYRIFLFKCDIIGKLSLVSFDAKKRVGIDLCNINELFLSGESEEVDLYGCSITKICLENENIEKLKIEKTSIKHYTLNRIAVKDIDIDTPKLVITDSKRFGTQHGQTIEDVSYLYHKMVLPASRSITETRKINYEIAKATSSKYLILFGYFFNPLYVFLWMIAFIFAFSILYYLLLDETFVKSIYFSIYTFLTIGFGDIAAEKHIFIKSILVFSEGFIGITYCAVFLTSIINSSKK